MVTAKRNTPERLPWTTLGAYGLPAVSLAAVGTTFYVFLPKFYSDTVGVPLALLSVIVLASRLWDAVIDPVIGHLSDRTETRFGRRRPWIAAALVPLALSVLFVMMPPAFLGTTGASVWLAVGTFLLFLFWTCIVVPYEAWGAELTFDYGERNRLYASREGALLLGTLVAAILPELLRHVSGHPSGATGSRRLFGVLAWAYVALLVPTVWICLRALSERALRSSQRPVPWRLSSLRTVLGNPPFRILLVSYTISALGAQLPATLILFYVETVLGSSWGGAFLILYLSVGFAGIPLWIRLGDRFDKKTVWMGAMGLNSGAFALVLLLGHGAVGAYAVLVCLSAAGLGGTLVLPASMEADTIDWDEWRFGRRREGMFSGLWSVARKLAAALGASGGLFLLDVAGYRANQVQPESVHTALRLLYAGVPCLCNAAALLVASRYPLSRDRHKQIRQEIDERTEQDAP